MLKGERMSANQEWFYSHNGNQVGPVSAADLKRLASTGQVSRSDLIWKDGWEDWKPAGAIKGLFPTVPESNPASIPLPAAPEVKLSRTTAAEPSSDERVPLWQRIPVAAFLTVCCFPVGLYLLWHNPRISRRTKLIWGGGFACLMVLGLIIEKGELEVAKAELAAANQLWDVGDKPAAISKYRDVIKSHLGAIPKSDRSLVIGRVVDFDAEAGNVSSVQELLKKAEVEHIVPSVSSEKAKPLVAVHSASTEAERGLTADYLLMSPGRTTSFAVQMFGQAGEVTFRETAKSDRLIEGESIEELLPIPGVTLKPITKKYTIRIRMSQQFAECDNRGIESDLKIKLGAKPGDEWDGNDKTKNERFRFVGFREVESHIGRAPASVKRALIELRQHQGTIRVRTEYLLEKGHGVVGIKMIDEGDGEHQECVFEMKKLE